MRVRHEILTLAERPQCGWGKGIDCSSKPRVEVLGAWMERRNMGRRNVPNMLMHGSLGVHLQKERLLRLDSNVDYIDRVRDMSEVDLDHH
jgi:hypothetical protein